VSTVALGATTLGRRPAEGRTERWRRIGRATWLQHRAALSSLGALYLLLALTLLVVGERSASDYVGYSQHRCAGQPLLGVCNAAAADAYGLVQKTLIGSLSFVPVVIGMFLGAPLLARELESGTFQFAFTQQTSRARLVAGKLAVLTAGLAAGAVLLALAAHPLLSAVDDFGFDSRWLGGELYLSPLAYPAVTVFAFMLGCFAGVLARRTLAAVAGAMAIAGGLELIAAAKLDRVVLGIDPLSTRLTSAYGPPGAVNSAALPGGQPAGSWLINSWYQSASGHRLSSAAANQAYYAMSSGTGEAHPGAWLALHHMAYFVSYQSSARYWWFQGFEALALLAVSALLAGGALALVQRGR
jgi:hypothetical protein